MFILKPVLDLTVYTKSMNQCYQVTRSKADKVEPANVDYPD